MPKKLEGNAEGNSSKQTKLFKCKIVQKVKFEHNYSIITKETLTLYPTALLSLKKFANELMVDHLYQS